MTNGTSGIEYHIVLPLQGRENLGLEPGALPPATVFQPFRLKTSLGLRFDAIRVALSSNLIRRRCWQGAHVVRAEWPRQHKGLKRPFHTVAEGNALGYDPKISVAL